MARIQFNTKEMAALETIIMMVWIILITMMIILMMILIIMMMMMMMVQEELARIEFNIEDMVLVYDIS